MAPALAAEAWAQIRYDYEHTDRLIEAICAEHGISSGTLRDRMRRWGWTRRRPPIPAEGPPAVAVPRIETAPPPLLALRVFDAQALPALEETSPHHAASRSQVHAGCVNLPASLGDDPPRAVPAPEHAQARSSWESHEAGVDAPRVAAAPAREESAPVEIDDASIVPRLQSAVARVLPAIETIVARLGTGVMQPREIEQAGRALGTLTRTLRELNALLNERQAAAANEPAEDEYGPRDIVAFRLELARRMDAIVAARQANAEGDATAGGDVSPWPGETEHESTPQLGPHVRSV